MFNTGLTSAQFSLRMEKGKEMKESSTAVNKKGLVGTYAFATTAAALNMTSGILAYIMITYSEVSSTNVALVMTIPAIVGTFFAFISGSLINKLGVKNVALFVHTMEFVSGMIYLNCGNKTSIYILYLAAALYGFMLGGQTVILAALYKEMVPNEAKRGGFIGIGSAVNSTGSVIFASLGGAIAAIGDGAHWERAFYLYFWILICIVVEIICLPGKNKSVDVAAEGHNKAKTKQAIPAKVWLISVHYLFFFLFLYAFSLNVSEYVITTHALGTSAQAGFCLSVCTMGGILSGLTYGKYSLVLKKWTMPALLSLSCIGLGLCVFVPDIKALYVAAFLMGVSMLGCSPYITVEMSRITTSESYTKAMSVFAGFMNGGMMFAVYILAFLATVFFGDGNSVDGKFTIAFVGSVIVCITSIPIYAVEKNK